MKPSLCISFRFIQPFPLFHGQADAGAPEWPPSPLRAFQALLNAACMRLRGQELPSDIRTAIKILETQHPVVVAPRATVSSVGYRAYVPHNQADLVIAAWDRGKIDASVASHRVEKDIRPYRIEALDDDFPTLDYIYSLEHYQDDPKALLNAIRPSVRSIHHLGWGIDQVVADATLVEAPIVRDGERWNPTSRNGKRLRVPRAGSLDALTARHERFLNRLVNGDWSPVPPLSALEYVGYRRDNDPIARPSAVFKLVDENDDTVTYSQSKLIHIAGMVRHLAIEEMRRNPPRNLRRRTASEWLETYVAGHRSDEGSQTESPHTQFSYVPMQSIGAEHTDPGVRRVMIVAPVGDEAWLEHLVTRLDGMLLKPLPNTNIPTGARLERIADKRKDGVRDAYLRDSLTWASVTPVILPGHDDHKPQKTQKLILKALAQSGIEQPCSFEWGPFSAFRKMLPAHKYRKDAKDPSKKTPINYIRPDHLLNQTAVHLRLTFEHPVPGPLAIGAGRHCGFGLMAAIS